MLCAALHRGWKLCIQLVSSHDDAVYAILEALMRTCHERPPLRHGFDTLGFTEQKGRCSGNPGSTEGYEAQQIPLSEMSLKQIRDAIGIRCKRLLR